MKLICVILLALISLANARPDTSSKSSAYGDASEEPSANSVWLLTKNYSQYVLSAPHNTLLGLTEDGMTVDSLNLAGKMVSRSYPLPLPGYRLAIGLDGTYATVVHNSFITFITVGSTEAKTLAFPHVDMPVVGLVAGLSNEHQSCGWIEYTESGSYEAKIICVSPASGNATVCDDQEGSFQAGHSSRTLGTPDNRMVYGMTEHGYVTKYTVQDSTPAPKLPPCLHFNYFALPNWGNYGYPKAAWFSYDRSRIFLNNGLTLTASSDYEQDVQEHGSFNTSFDEQILYWITQDTKPPNDVIALRAALDSIEFPLVVTTYTWPYLNAKDNIKIPVPTTPTGLSVAYRGHIGPQIYYNPTKNNEVYIIVNYTNEDSSFYSPGIAYLDISSYATDFS